MSDTTAAGEEQQVLRLEGEMTIYRAAELKEQLKAFLKPQTETEIDLPGVTEMDCSGFQLLKAFKRTVEAAGGTLRLSRHSVAVVDVFELLNVAATFGDPLVISPSAAPQAANS